MQMRARSPGADLLPYSPIALLPWREAPNLLDLAFDELDVLLRDRVVLLELELLGLRARVLLGHVEIARVRRRVQADLDDSRLSHNRARNSLGSRKRRKIRANALKSTRKPL